MTSKVSLVDITEDAERKIATYSAVCYGSKTDDASNSRRITHLLKLGHLATLRFATATFHIESISRVCSHQLVRSKHLDFLQESQRYVKQHNTDFTIPANASEAAKEMYYFIFGQAKSAYDTLIALGEKKEDARFVLPEATTTNLYVTGNLQAWYDFLKLRLDKAAQWEIRKVAAKVAVLLYEKCPHVFGEFYELAIGYLYE